ncbi:MAG: toluene tolerance protein [Deltaproteobacteria bacterium HGW-Deltaproteobacteria-15]|jgi:phospholipid transport system substrate-binding protein|nr:MAG: toluene tolerance protein [Deltaproteobacteria bacterium HGW-Deltaproteobacteria-15]
MNTKHLLLATCLVLSFLVHPVHAGEPTERVRALLNEVISVQSDPRLQGDEFKEKRRAAVKNIIGRNFDFDRMAERSLGEHWKTLSNEERSEFRWIFRDLFQDSYSFMVLENLGKEKILYKDEEVKEGVATVKTSMLRRNATLSVDYELANLKENWLIQDVTIDGVSILKNYQESFASVIRRDSYAKLIEKMRAKKREVEKAP